MSCGKLLAIVVCICALAAAPALATEYFWEDFETGDMAGWSDLSLHVGAWQTIPFGLYGWASRGEDPAGTKEARAIKDIPNTALADTVYFSFNFMHTGGYKGDDVSIGWKSTHVWMVDDGGIGYGIYVAWDKRGQTGQFEIHATGDFGLTVGGDPVFGVPGGSIVIPSGWIPLNDFTEHKVGVVWDRINATMDMYLDDQFIQQVLLEFDQNDLCANPTKIICGPRNTFNTTTQDMSGWMSTDNIWLGDGPNPNSDTQLAKGDTNGDLKVDIQDLTALATNWSALSPGAKDWTEGDFNWDWTVDIQDLTALATNWSFTGSPAPEPATLALIGLAGLWLLRRKH